MIIIMNHTYVQECCKVTPWNLQQGPTQFKVFTIYSLTAKKKENMGIFSLKMNLPKRKIYR